MGILNIKDKIKEYMKLIYICPGYFKILSSLKVDRAPRIVLIGTPAHGNLGDQAIAISEIDFLNKTAENSTVIEIPMPLYKSQKRVLKKYIYDNDTIIISGGGWMGNLWIHNEITIREIVSNYPNNRIIIFPQTLYYSEDDFGRQTLNDTKEIFNKHKDLILTVRDKKSFDCAQNGLKMENGKKLFFCPDMVVYGTLAKEPICKPDQKIALICLRKDIEKVADNKGIDDILIKNGYLVEETTTVLNKLIPLKQRNRVVADKMLEFKAASLVITDRLHAMLFALLSGTPCIVFNNATGKVFGVGEYLKNDSMPVDLVDKFDDSTINNCRLEKKPYKPSKELEKYFVRLACLVNNKEIV